MLQSKEVLAVTISYFTYGYVAWIFFSCFTLPREVRGLNPKASAIYSTLPFVAMAACSLLGGLVNDVLAKKWGPRVGRCSIAALALTLARFSKSSVPGFANTQLAVFVLAAALARSTSPELVLVSDGDIGGTSAGSVPLHEHGQSNRGMITAVSTPWIAARLGWTAAFLVAAGLSLCGAWLGCLSIRASS